MHREPKSRPTKPLGWREEGSRSGKSRPPAATAVGPVEWGAIQPEKSSIKFATTSEKLLTTLAPPRRDSVGDVRRSFSESEQKDALRMMESALDNPCYFTHTTFKPAPKDKSTLPAALTNSLKKRKGCSTPSLHPGDRDRRNRSLLRSLSANADDTRLLVLGNPRPSDLAPCESPKRGNGKGDFQGGDMVLCTGAAAPSEPPPPFLEPGPTPRYVNTATLPPPGRRRHSLTSFLRPVSAAALRVPDGHLYPRSTPAPVSETACKTCVTSRCDSSLREIPLHSHTRVSSGRGSRNLGFVT
ncbi:unnamed protein product [Bemisia tabaci]|uniref:Uncharacterized protein n=1 Tax=Bemisia tabaci TaxID=7038 RepID=A0A9P0EYS4_BEMTA|nr:unnamed protein product [Bemisia tabaci]